MGKLVAPRDPRLCTGISFDDLYILAYIYSPSSGIGATDPYLESFPLGFGLLLAASAAGGNQGADDGNDADTHGRAGQTRTGAAGEAEPPGGAERAARIRAAKNGHCQSQVAQVQNAPVRSASRLDGTGTG
ncbi:hypothetical protein VTI74DRAFT_10500 [Chaetomium olivicolor]